MAITINETFYGLYALFILYKINSVLRNFTKEINKISATFLLTF